MIFIERGASCLFSLESLPDSKILISSEKFLTAAYKNESQFLTSAVVKFSSLNFLEQSVKTEIYSRTSESYFSKISLGTSSNVFSII